MKKPAAILFPHASGWTIGTVVESDCTLAEVDDEAAVADWLKANNVAPAAWLTLPSRECLAACIPTGALPRRGRGLALRYRLEEQIPWAAEEMSASFMSSDESGGMLAVAVQTRTLDQRIESLRMHGIEVLGASPAMLLAAGKLMADTPCDAMLLRDETVEEGEWISLIQIARGEVAEWQLLPAEASEVVERLREMLPAEGRRLIACDLPAEWQSTLALSANLQVIEIAQSATELACREAVRVMDRGDTALADLCARPANAAALQTGSIVIVALLAALCIGLLWRTHRYDRVRDQFETASAATFQRLFPRTSMPAGVVSRLLGEARVLRKKAGNGTDTAQAMSLPPRLAKVLSALDALPPSARFAISDLRMDGGRLVLSGDVATLGDVDAVDDAIRGTGDWVVNPPRYQQLSGQQSSGEQLSGDISFTVEGKSNAENKSSEGELR